uniref:Uncharacterized protein n=1 Tax=Ananas comosus var. bracteatus TaxID=296719 RepID=A0A6V7P1R5_ANACO|nr:unnamed protein product [Ananas comosus var. bracteatus]
MRTNMREICSAEKIFSRQRKDILDSGFGSPSHLRECVRALGRRRLDRTYESVMAIGFHDCRCRRRPYPLGTAISSSHALLWFPFSVTGTSSVERATVLFFGLARARAICLYLILGVELCILLLISCCSVV